MNIGLWWGNVRERNHWEDPGADGRVILKWIFKRVRRAGMHWIDLAKDRDT